MAKIMKSGETTFKSRTGTFRFVISEDSEGKVNILLEENESRKEWCTGYLAMDQYVSMKNRIANFEVKDYVKIFQSIFSYCDYDEGDSFARKIFELENDELQLELSVAFNVLGKPCTVIYQFQLQPVSLQRIHTLEAKLRAVEEELVAQKARDTKKPAETVGFGSAAPSTFETEDGSVRWRQVRRCVQCSRWK